MKLILLSRKDALNLLNVTVKTFLFQINSVLSKNKQTNKQTSIMVSTKILSSTTVFNIDNNNKKKFVE